MIASASHAKHVMNMCCLNSVLRSALLSPVPRALLHVVLINYGHYPVALSAAPPLSQGVWLGVMLGCAVVLAQSHALCVWV